MCFVTHNRLIVIIAALSIITGILTVVSSALIIHNSEDLARVTIIHFRFLIACTFCTIGAGIMQSVSSLLYISRKIVTRGWIRTNAIVFGIFLIGISIAMVRFQSTLPEGFDPKVVVNRTEAGRSDMLNVRSVLPNTTEPKLNNSEENIDPVKVALEDQSKEIEETATPVQTPASTPTEPVEQTYTSRLGVPEEVKSKAVIHENDIPWTLLELEELVSRKGYLLKLYFGVIMFDFLALPIFLGLVSSKASKFDLKWRSTIQSW